MPNAKTAPALSPEKLDELKLRDELKALRAQIPDRPQLNPIVNVAFDLSRRLEGGAISFADLKALAVRLMDRALVQRALRLKEQIGFVDDATTQAEFAKFVDATMTGAVKGDAFEHFKERWSRARSGIVFTAHPTFGLSDALSRRLIDIAAKGTDAGAADRHSASAGRAASPSTTSTSAPKHRSIICAALTSIRLATFFKTAQRKFGDRALKLQTPTVDLCLVGRLRPRRAHRHQVELLVSHPACAKSATALQDIRDRFLVFKPKLGEAGETPRLVRQLTGKLDLAIAAVDEQVKALEQFGPGGHDAGQSGQRHHAARRL